MKNLKVLFSFLIVVLVVAFSGCDPCRNVDCQNGGSCLEGDCSCPDNFGGEFCEIDSCANVTCLNGGTCDGGACVCPTGYEGGDCGTQSRAKFIGSFIVTPGCSIQSGYTSEITNDANDETKILISNVYRIETSFGSTSKVSASVDMNDLTIPNQNLDVAGATWTIVGSGSINGNTVTLTYTLTDEFGNPNNCTDTMVK